MKTKTSELQGKAITITDEELRMIRGALIASATMLTSFGAPKPEQLETYRKLRNLADRLGGEIDTPEELV